MTLNAGAVIHVCAHRDPPHPTVHFPIYQLASQENLGNSCHFILQMRKLRVKEVK